MKLIDPSKYKATRKERKIERLKVFKRASTIAKRKTETEARKVDWEAVTNGTDLSYKSK